MEWKKYLHSKLLRVKNHLDGKTTCTKKTIWIQKLIRWKNCLLPKTTWIQKLIGWKNCLH
jgi:hypothetical protein